MLNIKIKTVLDALQRYNTVGDYYVDEKGEEDIVVSDMGDWRFEILTALHEIVESTLCQERGISIESIDAFDIAYEEKRLPGDVSEPGDDPSAPYYKEHQFANKMERMLADELGVDWEKYIKKVDALTIDVMK